MQCTSFVMTNYHFYLIGQFKVFNIIITNLGKIQTPARQPQNIAPTNTIKSCITAGFQNQKYCSVWTIFVTMMFKKVLFGLLLPEINYNIILKDFFNIKCALYIHNSVQLNSI